MNGLLVDDDAVYARVLQRSLERRGVQLRIALDAASALLLFLAPLLALVAARIRLTDGGGVIFAHTRVGRHGRLFPCFKFRTMVPNSAEVLAEPLRCSTYTVIPRPRSRWYSSVSTSPRRTVTLSPVSTLTPTSACVAPRVRASSRASVTRRSRSPCGTSAAEGDCAVMNVGS